MIRALYRLSSLMLPLALAACGGIEGTGSQQPGASESGFAEGGVSGFGSVFVNGVEYDTTQAAIYVGGTSAFEQALHVGMQLAVSGDVGADGRHGVAERIDFDRLVLGPIDAVEIKGRRLTLLGQTVLIDDDTVLVNATRQTLQPGDLCLLSGLRTASGGILATYLERQPSAYIPASTIVDVEGVVSALAADSFRIDGLTVDYRNAHIETDAGRLENGALVEVSGLRQTTDGNLVASSGHVKRNPAAAPRGKDIVIEGLITQFDSLSGFVVNGRHINAGAAQRLDHSTLVPADDVRAVVHGQLDQQGVLQARSYALRPPSSIRYSGQVDSVDAGTGQLKLLGVPVDAQPDTQFLDASSEAERSFALTSLAPGEYVELKVFRDAQGNRLAGRIQRQDPPQQMRTLSVLTALPLVGLIPLGDSSDAGVTGPADSFDSAAGSLQVVGVPVSTDLLTRYTDRNGGTITSMQFFAGLKAGDVLAVDGAESGDGIQANTIGYAD